MSSPSPASAGALVVPQAGDAGALGSGAVEEREAAKTSGAGLAEGSADAGGDEVVLAAAKSKRKANQQAAGAPGAGSSSTGKAAEQQLQTSKKQRVGMSPEEKRDLFLQWWRDAENKQGFFTGKELEKTMAGKGVRQPYYKQILDELLAENLVLVDKVGASTVYWLNPGKIPSARRQLDEFRRLVQTTIPALEGALLAASSSLAKAETKEETLPPGAPQSVDLPELRRQNAKLKVEIARLRQSDPEELAKMKAKMGLVKESANRWGWHIDALRSALAKQMGCGTADINAHFELLEEYADVV
mmetsp:Transcript_4341/g.10610  ORF Transcript_4341/g.10610 Transcript_4341/m.10610 type:complete len:301 (+) Transcript_4341:114-1016(+)|eukprot:CAMPEP_0178999976 /NCGR_PEP_ID=MMETSP0795-20121207/10396_1 /TAXON_ID=88552 /ORGANISM="Amoebophrya sp., Strain Ameob2" /LENGTH=300 /DNA_ID=CAMNT_0020692883 /DNA_START=8 /DNA_END=910 /DNA_ORIENTATION=+